MECVAFHFLNNPVGRHIMVMFQDDDVTIHHAKIENEWLGESMKNNFHTWIDNS